MNRIILLFGVLFVLVWGCSNDQSREGLLCKTDKQCNGLRCINFVCTSVEGVVPQEFAPEQPSNTNEGVNETTSETSSNEPLQDQTTGPESPVEPKAEAPSHSEHSTDETGPEVPQPEQSFEASTEPIVDGGNEQSKEAPIAPEPSQEAIAERPIVDGPPSQPKWHSVQGAQGPHHGTFKPSAPRMVFDKHDNLYITGRFEGVMKLGTHTLSSKGATDFFIAKMSPAGVWLWAKRGGGSSQDSDGGLAVGKNGDVYVAGSFGGLAEFGGTTLAFEGGSDMFYAKFDSKGNWLWVKQVGDVGGLGFGGLAIDSNDNIYVTGSMGASAKFGSYSIASTGSYSRGYVAKANSNGIWQWAKSINGYTVPGKLAAVDSKDRLYIVGMAAGEPTLDKVTIKKKSAFNVYIYCLDTTGKGKVLWSATAEGGKSDPMDISFDSKDNLYITGYSVGAASFGTTTFQGKTDEDAYVAKLDNKGQWQWAKQIRSAFFERAWGVATDRWDNVYVTGQYNGILNIGTTPLKSLGRADVYVASLTEQGQWRWALSAGGKERDEGRHIRVNSLGTAFVVGHFLGKGTLGTLSFTPPGSRNIFLAEIR